MTTTYINAIDEMYGQFNAAWLAGAAAISGYVPEVRWQGVEVGTIPDAAKYWCRVSSQTVQEPQTNIGTNQNGKSRYTSNGLVFVQIFAPLADDQSMANGRALAMLAKAAFRGKVTASGVIFRNVRINELAQDGTANRLNVVAEYEYDEIA